MSSFKDMKKIVSTWIYYRFARLSVRAKWAKNTIPELSKTQEKVLKITLASMFDENSELLINPTIDDKVGEKYYIKKIDTENNVEKFITISKTSMGYSIALIGHETMDDVRHDYHFDIWFNEVCGNIIIEKFRRILKRRRDKMEAEIRKDDERTLDLILSKMTKSL